MVKKLLKKYFNIHVGEYRIAFLMQLYIFLIITVLLLVKPTISALFIYKLGADKLPYGFLLIAITAIITSIFYNRMIKQFAIKKVAITTVITFGFLFLFLSYIIYKNEIEGWILYAYYIILSLFGVMVTSQFWVISNIVFNIREAKRLFGFIGAGGIAGGIFGGYLASIVAKYFGTEYVILLASFFLFLCFPVILFVWRIRINRLNKYIKHKRNKMEGEDTSNSFSVVLKSKHLINLSALVGVSVLVAKLVDYQFSYFAHVAYPNADELASFFGFWYSSFNIVALLIQLFLTNKLLTKFSLSNNMLLLPLTLFLGAILFFVFPELWVVIILKGADTSFKQSINKASFELSILPIPYQTKKQAKPFIDVVIDSIATGLSGFLLILIVDKLRVDPIFITLLIVLFLVLWIYLIFRIRESYYASFKENIIANFETESSDKIDTISGSIEILKNGTESEILKLLQLIKDDRFEVFNPYITKLLDHKSNEIIAAVLQYIYSIHDEKIIDKVRNIALNNNNDRVVYEAMEYLILHVPDPSDTAYLRYLDHEKLMIRSIALICLSKTSRYNSELKVKFGLKQRIQLLINELTLNEEAHRKEEIAELLIAIGYSGIKNFYFYIDKHLFREDEILKIYAIKAAGYAHHQAFILPLLKLLENDIYREHTIKSLQNYGDSVVETILELYDKGMFSNQIKMQLPAVIKPFDSKNTITILLRLIKNKDMTIRLNAAKILGEIESSNHKIKISDKTLNKLFFNECQYFKYTISSIESLEKIKDESDAQKIRLELIAYLKIQLNKSLETIFYLLTVKYSYSDMKIAYQGLKNITEETRINTVEFLSNLLQSNLKKELLPLLEYQFLSEENLAIETYTESKCLIKILHERGDTSKTLTLKLIQFLDKKPYEKVLHLLATHKNSNISQLSKSLLKDSM